VRRSDDLPVEPGTTDGEEDPKVEGNARLTASTAVVLFLLLAAEGYTILHVGPLLAEHVFIGALLVPPVLLKISSTGWRFVRYYTGSPEYRRKGPPPPLLRLLGPILVVLTVLVFLTGFVSLLGPTSLRTQWLSYHRTSFILWIGVMTIHVLGHLVETARLAPRDWMRRTRRQVQGASTRQWLVASSIAVGLILAVLVTPKVGPWMQALAPH
jgi:hypothetical protein